jgi:hypothetical protein
MRDKPYKPEFTKRHGPKDWAPGKRGKKAWWPIWPEFVDAYLEAALWTAIDEAGNPLRNFSLDDFSQEAVDQAIEDCDRFVTENRKDLEIHGITSEIKAHHGHDFWLTRNGHGAGYWDRGYDQEVGDRLTAAAEAYGQEDVERSSNGQLYFMNR